MSRKAKCSNIVNYLFILSVKQQLGILLSFNTRTNCVFRLFSLLINVISVCLYKHAVKAISFML